MFFTLQASPSSGTKQPTYPTWDDQPSAANITHMDSGSSGGNSKKVPRERSTQPVAPTSIFQK